MTLEPDGDAKEPWDYEAAAREAEMQRQYKCSVIEGLLASLKPSDANMDLFTFAERKTFHLRNHRKPPYRS